MYGSQRHPVVEFTPHGRKFPFLWSHRTTVSHPKSVVKTAFPDGELPRLLDLIDGVDEAQGKCVENERGS